MLYFRNINVFTPIYIYYGICVKIFIFRKYKNWLFIIFLLLRNICIYFSTKILFSTLMFSFNINERETKFKRFIKRNPRKISKISSRHSSCVAWEKYRVPISIRFPKKSPVCAFPPRVYHFTHQFEHVALGTCDLSSVLWTDYTSRVPR